MYSTLTPPVSPSCQLRPRSPQTLRINALPPSPSHAAAASLAVHSMFYFHPPYHSAPLPWLPHTLTPLNLVFHSLHISPCLSTHIYAICLLDLYCPLCRDHLAAMSSPLGPFSGCPHRWDHSAYCPFHRDLYDGASLSLGPFSESDIPMFIFPCRSRHVLTQKEGNPPQGITQPFLYLVNTLLASAIPSDR